jgi:hypothetical protein
MVAAPVNAATALFRQDNGYWNEDGDCRRVHNESGKRGDSHTEEKDQPAGGFPGNSIDLSSNQFDDACLGQSGAPIVSFLLGRRNT